MTPTQSKAKCKRQRDNWKRRCEAAESALKVIAAMRTGLERGKFGGHPDQLFFEARSLAQKTLRQLRAARPSTPADSGKE